MIIQCRQCRTKFRFDDSLMEGDGVWVRCSHCRHVFFQENPQAVKHEIEQDTEGIAAHSRESGHDEDVAVFLDDVMKAKGGFHDDAALEIERPVKSETDKDGSVVNAELRMEEDIKREEEVPRKKSGRILRIAVWSILVIVIIPAFIYFILFPQVGDRLLQVADKYVDLGFLGLGPTRPEVVTGQVKLQDIRQRILNNQIMGPIRIVEGMAVNQADYPISRIAVKGEIVDAYAVVLGERVVYAGNILNDEELTILPEEDIVKRLSRPEGANNSNDKIVPNGMIPFMIVFTREPTGVIKTTVKTVGAERLL